MGKQGDERRSIRPQLTGIVLVPSVTFIALFAVLSAAMVVQAISLKTAALHATNAAGLYDAEVELQAERRLAVEYLGDRGEESLAAFQTQIEATDEAVDSALPDAEALSSAGDPAVRERFGELLEKWGSRDETRAEIVDQQLDRATVLDRYGEFVAAVHHLFDAIGLTVDDGMSVAASTLGADLLRAQDTLARADALLAGAMVAGEFTQAEQTEFAGLVTHARRTLEDGARNLTGEPRRLHADLVASPEWEQAHALADEAVLRDPTEGTVPVAREEWREAVDTVHAGLVGVAVEQWDAAVDAADLAGDQLLTWSIGGGIVAIFVGALAFGVASRSSHRLIRRLLDLRRETLNLAQQELPRIVERLEQGEAVKVEDELKSLDYGEDEIGQVASAFNTAQRTAVLAAVRQADIREGANRVFLGIAHRNQSLVQRQLQLLDRVEREEEDPELLEDLFQLDHLATRGRRHAENLIILGGGQPGRRWRNPIPLIDVLRGAVSETEEYARVQLRHVPDLSLRGSAVADVIHLVAELVENATAFSPPHTVVLIHTETVPKGVVVEIEDRGLGMSEEDFASANRTLANAPEFDVMALTEDSRLGLFVVARLARRHDIGVQLRSSPYGGTRAIILIPGALVVPDTTSRGAPMRARREAALVSRAAGTSEEGGEQSEVGDQTGQHTLAQWPASPDDQGGDGTVLGNGTGPERSEVGGEGQAGNGGPGGAPAKARSTAGDGQEDPPPLPSRRSGAEPETAMPASRSRLPRRTRHANLASPPREVVAVGEETSETLLADEARQTMEALQSGTRQGRVEDLDGAGGAGHGEDDTGGRHRSDQLRNPEGDEK